MSSNPTSGFAHAQTHRGKKRGEENLTRERVLDSPRQVFFPPSPGVIALFCSCTEIQDRADQKLFWKGPEILLEGALSGTISSPRRFAPTHIMPE